VRHSGSPGTSTGVSESIGGVARHSRTAASIRRVNRSSGWKPSTRIAPKNCPTPSTAVSIDEMPMPLSTPASTSTIAARPYPL
jgi:hypothetical protein